MLVLFLLDFKIFFMFLVKICPSPAIVLLHLVGGGIQSLLPVNNSLLWEEP